MTSFMFPSWVRNIGGSTFRKSFEGPLATTQEAALDSDLVSPSSSSASTVSVNITVPTSLLDPDARSLRELQIQLDSKIEAIHKREDEIERDRISIAAQKAEVEKTHRTLELERRDFERLREIFKQSRKTFENNHKENEAKVNAGEATLHDKELKFREKEATFHEKEVSFHEKEVSFHEKEVSFHEKEKLFISEQELEKKKLIVDREQIELEKKKLNVAEIEVEECKKKLIEQEKKIENSNSIKITELEHEISAYKSIIGEVNSTLKQRESEIISCKKNLNEKIKNYEISLDEKNKALDIFGKNITEKEKELADLNNKINTEKIKFDEKINELKKEQEKEILNINNKFQESMTNTIKQGRKELNNITKKKEDLTQEYELLSENCKYYNIYLKPVIPNISEEYFSNLANLISKMKNLKFDRVFEILDLVEFLDISKIKNKEDLNKLMKAKTDYEEDYEKKQNNFKIMTDSLKKLMKSFDIKAIQICTINSNNGKTNSNNGRIKFKNGNENFTEGKINGNDKKMNTTNGGINSYDENSISGDLTDENMNMINNLICILENKGQEMNETIKVLSERLNETLMKKGEMEIQIKEIEKELFNFNNSNELILKYFDGNFTEASLTQVREKVERLEIKNNELEKSYKDVSQKLKSQLDTCALLEDKVDTYEKEKKKSDIETTKKSQKENIIITNNNVTIKNLKNEIEELKKSINDLKDKLRLADKKIKDEYTKIVENEIKMKNDFDSLILDFDGLKKEKCNIEKEYNELKNEMTKNNAEIKNKLVTKFENELNIKEIELNKLKNILKIKKSQLVAFQREYRDIAEEKEDALARLKTKSYELLKHQQNHDNNKNINANILKTNMTTNNLIINNLKRPKPFKALIISITYRRSTLLHNFSGKSDSQVYNFFLAKPFLLTGCENDMLDWCKILNGLGWSKENVRILSEARGWIDDSKQVVPSTFPTLRNMAHWNSLPTKKNIIENLNWLTSDVKVGERVALIILGAGTLFPIEKTRSHEELNLLSNKKEKEYNLYDFYEACLLPSDFVGTFNSTKFEEAIKYHKEEEENLLPFSQSSFEKRTNNTTSESPFESPSQKPLDSQFEFFINKNDKNKNNIIKNNNINENNDKINNCNYYNDNYYDDSVEGLQFVKIAAIPSTQILEFFRRLPEGSHATVIFDFGVNLPSTNDNSNTPFIRVSKDDLRLKSPDLRENHYRQIVPRYFNVPDILKRVRALSPNLKFNFDCQFKQNLNQNQMINNSNHFACTMFFISSCSKKSPAYEKNINGEDRGVLSVALTQLIRESDFCITPNNLIEKLPMLLTDLTEYHKVYQAADICARPVEAYDSIVSL